MTIVFARNGVRSFTICDFLKSRILVLWMTVFMVAAALLSGSVAAWADQRSSVRQLSVKDLIEMSYIINPSESPAIEDRLVAPIVSPDQKSFLLLTQRGVLTTNELEANIWVFDRNSVLTYLDKKSLDKPVPKLLASLGAVSNTPVISDVRWLEGSRKIAFLGKKNTPFQQLFVADVASGELTTLSNNDSYVTAYDVKGDTVAYTALDPEIPSQDDSRDVVDVLGKSIYSLLFPFPLNLENLDESSILIRPNSLHLVRNGRETPVKLAFQGRPLKLFMPMLSLSPDGKFLITIAPVDKIPANWAEYRPALDISYYHLTPDNHRAIEEDNIWKAAEPVIVDLQTSRVSPLVNAPTGRSLLYIYDAPTRAIWSEDSCRVILSDTFLPLEGSLTDEERRERSSAPAIIVVDRCKDEIQPVTFVGKSPYREKIDSRVIGTSWSSSVDGEIELSYSLTGANRLVINRALYRLVAGEWSKEPNPGIAPDKGPEGGNELGVKQDFNHPPVLSGFRSNDQDTSIIWDPNPQFANISLGKASLYHWQDKNGRSWAGILVLPPDFKANVRYPLVIQTHGHDPDSFFAEGEYTTGNAGRALTAKEIIVLQMDEPDPKTLKTPENGPSALLGFESAVETLSSAGMVDPHRVGVIGFSFTCFHVLYALTHKPDLFAAASITDGNDLSYVQYVLSTDTHNTIQEVDEKTYAGVPFGKNLIHWTRDAPDFNLDQVRTPLLISAFEKGHLLSEWEPYSGLRRLGKPVDMVWFPKQDAPHVLVQPRHRYLSEGSAVDWFTFWLRGEEDSDSAKADQYRRWKDLRTLRNNNRAVEVDHAQ
jgi:Prolyl oligopeptidase family